jgi:hypothetical protein
MTALSLFYLIKAAMDGRFWQFRLVPEGDMSILSDLASYFVAFGILSGVSRTVS